MENKKNSKKISLVFILNLALAFTLVGIIISFFIFSMERNKNDNSFLAYAQNTSGRTVPAGLDEALSVQSAIRKVVNNNMAGVVNVSTEIAPVVRQNSGQDRYAEEFFRYFFGEQMPERKNQKSLGSGFIIDSDGYVLSNYHVVKGASKIVITLYGEENEYPAELIGYDEAYDLALLKITAKRKFPYVSIGDSDAIEPGDFAVAIGNPYGLNNTVTFGIISAKGRSDVGANRYQRYIQTDVAINPGNSGGPLFNIYGEVIGINTMIYSTSGGSIGLGFATPINIAKNVLTQLKETGRVMRGYLGVYPQDIDENLSKGLNIRQNSGVYVSEVLPDSPAAKAGLEDGDIITELDGKKMQKAADLFNTVAELTVGKQINIKYIRNGKERVTKAIITSRPEEVETSSVVPGRQQNNNTQAATWLGLDVSNITVDLAKRLQIKDNEKGVVVINMMQSSRAYQSGLRPGDVIKAINGKTISNIDDYNNFVKNNEKENTFNITIKRARMTYVIVIE